MPSPVTLSNKLLCGRSFRAALIHVAGGYRNVRRIVAVKGAPDPDVGELVSFKRGPRRVYATYDDATGTVTLTSEADRLLMNEDASEMFSCLTNLEDLDALAFDTSRVTDMSQMFEDCSGDAFTILNTAKDAAKGTYGSLLSSGEYYGNHSFYQFYPQELGYVLFAEILQIEVVDPGVFVSVHEPPL